MKIRKLSFLLAAMIALSSLASCAGGSASGDDTTVSGDDSGSKDQTSATYKGFPALEDKNFNGEEVNLLIRTEWDYEFDIDEETGDTVPDAVFKRNQAVEDKYARDEESLEMIGIIRDGLTFDFGWIHSMATNVSGARYENLVVANDANFASQYAEQESVTEEQTNKLLECYE